MSTFPVLEPRLTRDLIGRCCKPCAARATAWKLRNEAEHAARRRILRTTPFRLTLLLLALFAAASSAFLAYIYVATVGEVLAAPMRRSSRKLLTPIRLPPGRHHCIEPGDHRTRLTRFEISVSVDGQKRARPSRARSPHPPSTGITAGASWASFEITQADPVGAVTKHPARGLEENWPAENAFLSESTLASPNSSRGQGPEFPVGRRRVDRGAGTCRRNTYQSNVSRSIAGLTEVIEAARGGDLHARARVRGTGDEGQGGQAAPTRNWALRSQRRPRRARRWGSRAPTASNFNRVARLPGGAARAKRSGALQTRDR